MGQKLAYTAHRVGVAERVAEPAVHKSLEVDLALMGPDDALRRDLAWSGLTTAQAHHPHTRSGRRPVPGLGESLRLVLRDDLHDSHRCPRVQDCVASGRVVTCAQASAGTRDGTGGRTIGKASLPGAFAEAAVRGVRDHPRGQKDRPRVEKQHGQGKALPIWAQHGARAVYGLFTRHTAFERHTFLQGEGRWSGCA
jgi:hypothetical protein